MKITKALRKTELYSHRDIKKREQGSKRNIFFFLMKKKNAENS